MRKKEKKLGRQYNIGYLRENINFIVPNSLPCNSGLWKINRQTKQNRTTQAYLECIYPSRISSANLSCFYVLSINFPTGTKAEVPI